MTKRGHGEGGIYEQGENTFRLRYRVGKKRFNQTFTGTLSEARAELRRLLRSGDTGRTRRAGSDYVRRLGQTLD